MSKYDPTRPVSSIKHDIRERNHLYQYRTYFSTSPFVLASLYHQQAISLMEKRLVATNKVSLSDLSINFFISFEIQHRPLNIICIFSL